MNRKLVFCIVGLAALLFVTSAYAQFTPGDVLKTPPMAQSDSIIIPLGYHNPNTVVGWAGSLLSVHLLDNQEVDIVAVGTAGGTVVGDPFGPASHNTTSVTKVFTNWHPNAQLSGTILPGSANVSVGGITLHAKNTNPLNNSDVDVVIGLHNIIHLQPGPSSSFFQLGPSDWVYANPGTSPITFSEIPTNPAQVGLGTWIHLSTFKTFHNNGLGSFFYATLVGTFGIGVEHVPEPASIVLLAMGIGCAVIGVWTRRRSRLTA